METWLFYIDRYKRKYDKAYMAKSFLMTDNTGWIQNQVQVLLNFCNTEFLENMEMAALTRFGKIQWIV